jgi:transposase-like protein
VRAFCQQHGANEHSFYQWRKRLAAQVPVKFALVDTDRTVPARTELELILRGGARLRIASGFDAATLRAVLRVLRDER